MSSDQQPRERRGPEYVRHAEHVAMRRKYAPLVRRVGLSIGILLVAGVAAYVAVPQLSGASAVNRVLTAIEKAPPAKLTTVIFDSKGSKMTEYVDYVHGLSWRGDFEAGRRVHVQTPIFKYVFEKDFNVFRTYSSQHQPAHALAVLQTNLQVLKGWGKGSGFKALSNNRYQFVIPGKRYTLAVNPQSLPTLLTVEMESEDGFSKAAEVKFDYATNIGADTFIPDISPDAQQIDMQQAAVRDATKLQPIAVTGNRPDDVDLISFDVSRDGNVFILVRSRQVQVQIEDQFGNTYVDSQQLRTWNYTASGDSKYYWSQMYVPLDDKPWTPRKYKLTFKSAPTIASQPTEVLGTLDVDAPKVTCDTAPTRYLSNMPSAGEYLSYKYIAMKTRAKTLKDMRIDSQGKIHISAFGAPNSAQGEVLRQDEKALWKAIEVQKDILRLSMFHLTQPSIVRANAYSQIYDVYRYNLGMSAEAKKALDLTFETYKLIPERVRESGEAQDARSVLGEEGLLELIAQ